MKLRSGAPGSSAVASSNEVIGDLRGLSEYFSLKKMEKKIRENKVYWKCKLLQ